jgi:hypothetical protein
LYRTRLFEPFEAERRGLEKPLGQPCRQVHRPDFQLGQSNPWPEVFDEFSHQIRREVGAAADLLAARFSTSSATELAAFDICLMDSFQAYFEYEMAAGCGIPEITVLGTPDDWLSMIPRLRKMAGYGLELWASTLEPVLQQIAATAAGQIDREFWLSFFRYQSGSGPAELTGWMVTLFPYLIANHHTKELEPNRYLENWRERFDIAKRRESRFLSWDQVQGPGIAHIPEALVSAPLVLKDLRAGKEHAMRLVAGPFGVAQHPETLALFPVFGWAVVYDVPPDLRRVIEVDEVTGLRIVKKKSMT